MINVFYNKDLFFFSSLSDDGGKGVGSWYLEDCFREYVTRFESGIWQYIVYFHTSKYLLSELQNFTSFSSLVFIDMRMFNILYLSIDITQ